MDLNVTIFWNSSAFMNSTIIFNASSEARSFVILVASWCVVPVFCAGALLNAAVLLTFLVHANQLINSFSIHIVNLTVLDLAYCLLLSPLILYRNFDESWLHSPATCGFYKYASWTISNLIVWQHLVVSVDRWLAFIVPIWYREKKTALTEETTSQIGPTGRSKPIAILG
ncbi:hypothetical protein RvY_07524 [Ramazzottius varieornatus]|uniref:G-protein coupled receptors family 1 profile domain-containing protein n=1 Tax=Ramazzottius varieornatus TaxID=947166 RepID=A0A1D1VBY4_RAMVA|nr:hypothetical protein RvY_07524 [Ramazzottius varieornatus]